jgi:hypothetical protein
MTSRLGPALRRASIRVPPASVARTPLLLHARDGVRHPMLAARGGAAKPQDFRQVGYPSHDKSAVLQIVLQKSP